MEDIKTLEPNRLYYHKTDSYMANLVVLERRMHEGRMHAYIMYYDNRQSYSTWWAITVHEGVEVIGMFEATDPYENIDCKDEFDFYNKVVPIIKNSKSFESFNLD